MIRALYFVIAILSFAACAEPADCDPPKFSPNGGVEHMIVQHIGGAKTSVRVLAYGFTSKPIAATLIAAQKRGVDVQVIVDKSTPSGRGNAVAMLVQGGVTVLVDDDHRIAHNKTMVVDGWSVQTGSYNFTASAEKANSENAVLCRSTAMAASYTADFMRHRSHSKEVVKCGNYYCAQ